MTSPAGVVLVTGEYPPQPGGVGDYTERLRGALEQAGLSTRVITRRTRNAAEPAEPGVARTVTGWDIRAVAAIARAAPRHGVVHVQFQAGAFDLRGEICLLPLVLRRFRPDVASVATFHDVRIPYLFPKAGRMRGAALRTLARTSHATLAADPADLRWLGPGVTGYVVPIGSNVRNVPPPDFDRAGFRARLGLAPTDLAVAYFGFLNRTKGLATLLAAFRAVVERTPGARLFLLGGQGLASNATHRAAAATFAGELGSLAEWVVQPGYLADERDLSAYLLSADVALLPYDDGASMRRGSMLACAEHGLPIVTTEGPGLTDLLRATVRARPAGDAAGLATEVLAVVTQPGLAARLRDASQALAASVAWPAIARRHLEVYAEASRRAWAAG